MAAARWWSYLAKCVEQNSRGMSPISRAVFVRRTQSCLEAARACHQLDETVFVRERGVRGCRPGVPRHGRLRSAAAARPIAGVVGGPYKVVAAEFTGDQVVDLVVGFHNCDAVTVERGGSDGKFSRWALYPIPFDDQAAIETVHNLDHGDVDRDGRTDWRWRSAVACRSR